LDGATWSLGAAGGCSGFGKPGRTPCSSRAPRGRVPGVPNSCRIAVVYFSAPRGDRGEDVTLLRGIPYRHGDPQLSDPTTHLRHQSPLHTRSKSGGPDSAYNANEGLVRT
jgi:hypothetical protein